MADLNGLKRNLRQYVEGITQHSGGGLYVCPLCGSGTGAHKTGAFSIDKSGEHWKCFACEAHGDIYDLCAAYENISLSEATREIMDIYGQTTPQRNTAAADFAPVQAQEETSAQNFAEDIKRFAAAMPGSPAQSYLQGRGLTLETIKRFNLGYDKERNSVIIPYNSQGSYYGRRSIDPNSPRPHDNLKGVQMPLFNAAALYNSPVVFVVESPICAISIAQEGGAAVALSGVGGAGRLYAQLKSKPTDAVLVICLDNDSAGRKAAEGIDAELNTLDIFHVDGTAAIMGTETDPAAPDFRKDPNEVLQKNGAEELREAVAYTAEEAQKAKISIAQELEAERAQRTGAGITDIDRALYGGFMRQQLIVLGAAPGAGKTAFAQWVFEGMAAQGITTCIYLNLEMSREQVLARSLSRIAKKQGNTINALQIMQGYKWTDEQRTAIENAAQEYKERIAPSMIYNPDEISADLDTIAGYIEAEARRAENAGNPAPVVVLDYLQLLTGQPREDAASVIKRAVMLYKADAIKHNSLVFMIIAHNRQANSTGAVSMEAARDTSAIEYSADLQLALTFTKCLNRPGRKAKSPDELTPEEMREITLRILKGRFGGRGTDVDLNFNGGTMTYTQTASEFTETDEPSPFATQGKTRLRY